MVTADFCEFYCGYFSLFFVETAQCFEVILARGFLLRSYDLKWDRCFLFLFSFFLTAFFVFSVLVDFDWSLIKKLKIKY